jgi:hypothetical protein
MSCALQSYDCKAVGETATFSYDFAQKIPVGVTITGVVCVAIVYMAFGAAGDTSGMMVGTATLNGTIASQLVSGGVDGVTYVLQFTATCSDGETILGQALVPVATFV